MSPSRKTATAAGAALAVGLVVVGANALGSGTKPTLGDDLVAPVGESISAPEAMTLVAADPGENADAQVSAEQAFEIARDEEGAPGDPKEASATFAQLSWGSFVDTPVWVITYPDACVPLGGPPVPGKKPVCALVPMNTLIDATKSKLIISFARSEDGYDVRPMD